MEPSFTGLVGLVILLIKGLVDLYTIVVVVQWLYYKLK